MIIFASMCLCALLLFIAAGGIMGAYIPMMLCQTAANVITLHGTAWQQTLSVCVRV